MAPTNYDYGTADTGPWQQSHSILALCLRIPQPIRIVLELVIGFALIVAVKS